jgi:signal transduction histidine kinase
VRLGQRVAELENDNAAAEAFAAVAAHELLAPLAMFEAFAASVSARLGQSAHESKAELAAIQRGAARTRILVGTLLEEARARHRRIQHRRVDLNRVGHDCIAMLAPEIEARKATVEIGELPEVYGDAALLGSVFTNLIVNALKYSPRNDATIRIDAIRVDPDWTIRFESHGRPIPDDDLERIFAPFHHGRSERRAHGAGLGLAICRRIVERHGGTMTVASRNGTGNSFLVTLPAASRRSAGRALRATHTRVST